MLKAEKVTTTTLRYSLHGKKSSSSLDNLQFDFKCKGKLVYSTVKSGKWKIEAGNRQTSIITFDRIPVWEEGSVTFELNFTNR